MFRADHSTAVGALAAATTAGTPGYYGADTVVTAEHLNMLVEELMAIVTAGGLTPDKANRAQVLAGIRRFTRTNMQVFTSSGTFVVPDGVTSILLRCIGGGGGGGGSTTCNGSQVSAAPGGNAGCYAEGVYTVTPGASYAVTIGAAGTAGASAGGNGGNGGTTSFGALISAPGGHGAPGAPAAAPPLVQGPNGVSFTATGGQINMAEASGQPGIAGGLANVMGGPGGGLGGGAATGGSGGASGTSRGSAGSGASTLASGTGSAGGAGAPGLVVVEY